MVEVDAEKLRSATDELIATLLPLAEDASTLADGTHLSAYQWGAIGAATVAGNYTPAREYQARQLKDFVACLNGVHAGLLSVVAHYRAAELAALQAAADVENKVQKVADLQAKLRQDQADLAEARKKDQGLTD
ncbi:hypothetical protein HS048_31890 [Planomonospora sp. ID91781]|uniref:Uncharacterized protein n=3 Tax=Planomonospora TaxID=1998 RepID=A0A171D049_9ACTN|nr:MULTISPECIES: hypothetical protein [Planomonospora]MBG0825293.1 hypothetical protein [Planomonospora sp. ID91781]GAT67490.1 hypothetical protein PS9374_03145 [Planomonospora sphaerica]GGK51389.1 hypothetical protein GCM10010126_08610 [Planomonospora parontospora]GGL39543.1 hypothetical protein GCM10014719_45760 [Planomonospora parontospora subsp. antibiotica]GII07002.1 hypothetical protein Ppa06_08000 [Planomonospora parontospora subsp. parontospora]